MTKKENSMENEKNKKGEDKKPKSDELKKDTQGKKEQKNAENNMGSVDEKKNSFLLFIKKNPVLVTAFIGILAVLIVYLWKDLQGQRQKKEIIEVATLQLEEKNQEMMMLIARPMVWSIRSEMLRGNLEQVDMFTTDMVRMRNFQFIYLIEPDGNTLISTDKRMEGQQFEERFRQEILKVESTVVFPEEENLLVMAAPVMGYDRRLATLVVAYRAENILKTD
ncbi:MAG: hypothetical protein EA393_00985 [Bacteroidetes bacterium]|nr:MAG: hypothetical protein EA393_00985 [Bacteroidota bacterium]